MQWNFPHLMPGPAKNAKQSGEGKNAAFSSFCRIFHPMIYFQTLPPNLTASGVSRKVWL
jgi:hypothetical protein